MKIRYKTIYNPNTLSTYKVPVDKNGNVILSKKQKIQNKLDSLFARAETKMNRDQSNVDVLVNKKTHKVSFVKVNKSKDLRKILDKSTINDSQLLFDFPYNMSMLKSALKYDDYYNLNFFVNIIIIHAKLDADGLRQAQHSFLVIYDDMQNHYAKRFLQVLKKANLQIRYLTYLMPVKYTHDRRDNVKLSHDLLETVAADTHIYPKNICDKAKDVLKNNKNSLFLIDKIYSYTIDYSNGIKSILAKDLSNDVQAYVNHQKLTQRANLLAMKLDDSFFDKDIEQSSKILNRIEDMVTKHSEMMEVCSNDILNVNASFKNNDKNKKQVHQIAKTALSLMLIALKDMKTNKDNLLISSILLDWTRGQSIFYKFIYSKLESKLNLSSINSKIVHKNLDILIKYIESNFDSITKHIEKLLD